jgi:hypothetical protein
MSRRRVIKHAIVFLLLGAIVNVAVAWLIPKDPNTKSWVTITWPNGTTSDHIDPEYLSHGWPMAALISEVPARGGGARGTTIPIGDVELAALPLWPGFAFNSVFYAAVLWLLFASPFALRKWRRIRRGLCPNCGYDLRGGDSATCPECGATVTTPGKDRSVSLPAALSPKSR